MKTRLLVALFGLSLLLSACGNKGALVRPGQVPDETSPDQSTPATPAVNPDDATVPEDLPETPPMDDGDG